MFLIDARRRYVGHCIFFQLLRELRLHEKSSDSHHVPRVHFSCTDSIRRGLGVFCAASVFLAQAKSSLTASAGWHHVPPFLLP
jgi:hypothetical protein